MENIEISTWYLHESDSLDPPPEVEAFHIVNARELSTTSKGSIWEIKALHTHTCHPELPVLSPSIPPASLITEHLHTTVKPPGFHGDSASSQCLQQIRRCCPLKIKQKAPQRAPTSVLTVPFENVPSYCNFSKNISMVRHFLFLVYYLPSTY